MIFTPWVHAVCGDGIEPFGCLMVALRKFGAERAGIFTDRIGFIQAVVFVIGFFKPKFKNAFLFERTDKCGGSPFKSSLRYVVHDLRRTGGAYGV